MLRPFVVAAIRFAPGSASPQPAERGAPVAEAGTSVARTPTHQAGAHPGPRTSFVRAIPKLRPRTTLPTIVGFPRFVPARPSFVRASRMVRPRTMIPTTTRTRGSSAHDDPLDHAVPRLVRAR